MKTLAPITPTKLNSQNPSQNTKYSHTNSHLPKLLAPDTTSVFQQKITRLDKTQDILNFYIRYIFKTKEL